jgi:hypothetical protein
MHVDRADAAVPFPRGVAARDEQSGYLEDGEDAITAVDLKTGQQLWRSAEASLPLLMVDSRLVALAFVPGRPNAVRFVVLDAGRAGQRSFVSEPVLFPPWLSVETASPEEFSCHVRLDGNAVVLDWKAHARYRGGAAPSPEIERQARQASAGTVQFDLGSGRGALHARTDSPVRPTPATPEVVASAPYRTNSHWSTEPWVAGSKRATLSQDETGTEPTLQLTTWDRTSGKDAVTIPLATGSGLVPTVTPDGRYLFVVQPSASTASTGDQRWLVFSVETGQVLARLEYENGAGWPCVLGDRVYYLVQGSPQVGTGDTSVRPWALMTRRLATGEQLWVLTLASRAVSRPAALRQSIGPRPPPSASSGDLA